PLSEIAIEMLPEFVSGAAITMPADELAGDRAISAAAEVADGAARPNVLPFPLAASGAGG
ncbi:MAG: hypothetical protein H0V17_27985, partial [Deltaproteobacteria bacterium]|nr:hypothetical protein [Deltaproteobacteria bacterium]